MREPERRARLAHVTLEDRGDDAGPVIVGYAAVFERETDLGWFTEEVAPGAFKETIEDDDIRSLVDHDSSRILGRTSAETLRVSEDERGLRMEIDVPDTSAGRDIVTSIKRGDVDGASFSFDVLDDKWETRDGKDHRTLERVKLYDVGPVTFPAYTDTTVAARSLEAVRNGEEVTKRRALQEQRERDEMYHRQRSVV